MRKRANAAKPRRFMKKMGEPWSTWFAAAGTAAVSEALAGLYAQLDAAVAARGPTCWASGKCCHFDAYGHRLYVTGIEIAWLLSHDPTPAPTPAAPESERPTLAILQDAPAQGGCPYQVEGLCSVHTIRPMGCRVFFCQRGTEAWQRTLYEDFLARLRRLHDAHGLPYRYMEWRAGLREAAEAAPASRR